VTHFLDEDWGSNSDEVILDADDPDVKDELADDDDCELPSAIRREVFDISAISVEFSASWLAGRLP